MTGLPSENEAKQAAKVGYLVTPEQQSHRATSKCHDFLCLGKVLSLSSIVLAHQCNACLQSWQAKAQALPVVRKRQPSVAAFSVAQHLTAASPLIIAVPERGVEES